MFIITTNIGSYIPLLISPIDGKTPMQQIKRNGIELDYCPVSGGFWLDRGELEKLLTAAEDAAKQDRQEYAEFRQSHPQQPHHGHKSYKYDDDDYEDYYKRNGKKSKLNSLMSLFD
jgi:Zn-finger nucleic acid-binding protein